jgi:hypothetical protein
MATDVSFIGYALLLHILNVKSRERKTKAHCFQARRKITAVRFELPLFPRRTDQAEPSSHWGELGKHHFASTTFTYWSTKPETSAKVCQPLSRIATIGSITVACDIAAAFAFIATGGGRGNA